jgi:hypothetical protein
VPAAKPNSSGDEGLALDTDSARVVPLPAEKTSAPPKRRSAYARFKDALHEFSDHPTSDNAVRYLAASRALDESRRLRSLPALAESGGELPPAA